MIPYDFRPATMKDLPLLRRWQDLPHVQAWWDGEDPFDAADLADPRVAFWIVSHQGRPFAFLQDYALHVSGPHPLDLPPPGSRGIDVYIGEPGMTCLLYTSDAADE